MLSRNISKYRLPPPFEELLDPSAKVKGVVRYAINKLDPIILSDEPLINDLEDVKENTGLLIDYLAPPS